MNEKQLTKDEIQQLFRFMEEHGVKFYDVQVEMVDHFASEIEQNWNHYPAHWAFKNKILDIYSRIGPIGFDQIIQTKSKAINKWFWNYCFDYIKSFFSWPKILITLLLMGLFYTVIMQSNTPIKFGKQVLFNIVIIPHFLFVTALYLKEYLQKKVHILSLLIIYSSWSLVGINGIASFFYICKATALDQQTIMLYILTVVFAFCIYLFTASAIAFHKCYKEFKLQYPKLT